MSKTELTDRELLALAAKAVGLGIDGHNENKTAWVYRLDDIPDENGECDTFVWRPLTDDGDALRLAVKLGLTLHAFPDHHQGAQSVVTMTRHAIEAREYAENNADDLNAAARRAIVRAAAAIGQKQGGKG